MFWAFGLFLFEKKWHDGFYSDKNVNFQSIGQDFFMNINLKNISAIVIPSFLLYVGKFRRVLVT